MEQKDKFVMKDKVTEKRCNYCGGTLRPVAELFRKDGDQAYENFKKAFKEQTGLDWKESSNWNCIECGFIYDENFINTGNKVGWLEALKSYYG